MKLIKRKYKRSVKTRQSVKDIARFYWGDDTEKAIIVYNSTDDINQRNKIFEEKLKYPFTKLIECIYNRHKFPYIKETHENARHACLTHCLSGIHLFDPNRNKKNNHKSYSYFSVTAKNYFVGLNNQEYERDKKHVPASTIGEATKREDSNQTFSIRAFDAEIHYNEEKSHQQKMYGDLLPFLADKMEKYIKDNQSASCIEFNKTKFLKAVVVILRNPSKVEQFNKRGVFSAIRQVAGFNPRHKLQGFALKKIKHEYKKWIKEWYENNAKETSPS